MFINRNCEYSIVFARRMKAAIHDVSPGYPVEFINLWSEPEESRRRGSNILIVNAVPITSNVGDVEGFKQEATAALGLK